MRNGRRLASVAIALFLLAAVSAVHGASVVGGVVRDPLGRAISQVEVFLVSEGGRAATLTSASDPGGRFVFPTVPPGLYRVAAVKSGYDVYVGRINTALRSTIDLVLHPLPQPGDPRAAVVPDDPGWVLRLPRRSVWQDTAPLEPISQVSSDDGNDAVASAARAEVDGFELGGVVDHTFAIAAADPESWDGGVQGQETRMALASVVGEATQLRLNGFRRRTATTAAADEAAGDEPDVAQGGRAVSGVALGMSYRGAADSAFDIDAFYSRAAFEGSSERAMRQAEAAWGASAAWSMQLDRASKIDVVMDYGETSYEAPTAAMLDPAAGHPGEGGVLAAWAGRWLDAAGAYRSVPADGHQVTLGVRAQFAHLPVPTFVPAAFSGPRDATGDGAWSVHLQAEDSWSVAAPLTLTYGVGYRHRIAAQDVSFIIPRFGAVWNANDLSVRALVAYHSMVVRDTPLAAPGSAPAPETSDAALGYELEVDAALSPTVRLRTAVAYSPTQEMTLGFERAARDMAALPLYLTDGQASVFEASAGLARDVGRCTAYAEGVRGRVEGSVAPVLPFDTPFQALTSSRLDYRTTRVGLRVSATGTDVRIEHRRVFETPLSPSVAQVEGSQRDDLALRVLQDIVKGVGGAAWRMLFAVQSVELGDGDYAVARIGGTTYRLPASHYQVNAGMSVAF